MQMLRLAQVEKLCGEDRGIIEKRDSAGPSYFNSQLC